MIAGKRVLAVVTARGGSKGIPRKNLREAGGRPLLAWSIAAGQASRYIDRLVLSSEDHEIVAVALRLGCDVPFVRPPELAADDTPGVEPVLHALERLPEYDYVVLLQPTSPLRISEDIDRCLELCEQQGAPACVSVRRSRENPCWTFRIGPDGYMSPLVSNGNHSGRRQDYPIFFVLNGAVYVARPDWLKRTRSFVAAGTIAYVMPEERSLDIDEEEDFQRFISLVGA